jgi:hypothetical protein
VWQELSLVQSRQPAVTNAGDGPPEAKPVSSQAPDERPISEPLICRIGSPSLVFWVFDEFYSKGKSPDSDIPT